MSNSFIAAYTNSSVPMQVPKYTSRKFPTLGSGRRGVYQSGATEKSEPDKRALRQRETAMPIYDFGATAAALFWTFCPEISL
jgi:hypothetical protein